MPAKHEEGVAEWLDSIEVDRAAARDAAHLRRIMAAVENVAVADQELHEAVNAARAAGDSWAAIGMALGVSRQAAYQRFGQQ
jgi:hypothetical protein